MNEQSFETIHCSRCTREASREEMDSHRLTGLLPDGWEGWLPDGGVCPGCQSAFWHPHCRSLVDIEGERVDVQAIPREEWTGEVDWCDYVDRENGYLEENWPDLDVPGVRWHRVRAGALRLVQRFDRTPRDRR